MFGIVNDWRNVRGVPHQFLYVRIFITATASYALRTASEKPVVCAAKIVRGRGCRLKSNTTRPESSKNGKREGRKSYGLDLNATRATRRALVDSIERAANRAADRWRR
jgi:hypothetical protein